METPKFAVFRFFRLLTCGPCHAFFNGPWVQLSQDKELINAGVVFSMYPTGVVKDEKTGKMMKYNLPDEFIGRIPYFPFLDLALPDSTTLGISYEKGKSRDYKTVKEWILRTIKSPSFLKYKDAVKSGNKPMMTKTSVKNLATRSIENPIPTPDVESHRRTVPENPRQTSEQNYQQDNSNIATSSTVVQQRKPRKFIPINM